MAGVGGCSRGEGGGLGPPTHPPPLQAARGRGGRWARRYERAAAWGGAMGGTLLTTAGTVAMAGTLLTTAGMVAMAGTAAIPPTLAVTTVDTAATADIVGSSPSNSPLLPWPPPSRQLFWGGRHRS